MPSENSQTVIPPKKSPIELSWVFALCGVIFSLLVFLLLMKQEQETSVAAFADEFSSQLQQLQAGLQRERRLASVLASMPSESAQPVSLSSLAQLYPATPAYAELSMPGQMPALQWLQPETDLLSASLMTALSELATEQPDLSAVETEAGSILLNRAARQDGAVITFTQLSELLSQSGLDQLPQGVSFNLKLSGQTLLSVNSESADRAAAVSTARLMLNNEEVLLTLAATDDYLEQYRTLLPALVLLTGLMLSFLLGAQMKRQAQRLREFRESRDRIRQQLEAISTTDAQTGLANQAQFEQVMFNEVRRAVREFNPLSLMLVQIDGYREFEEHYGQDKQEWMLCQVATVLSHCISRPGDLLARVEADRFAFVLPSTNENAGQLAERCCHAVQELSIRHADSGDGACVTVSIGLVTMQPSDQLSFERILLLAREQLDAASAEGGGKYRVFTEQLDDLELGFGA